ncbi:phosphoheptose isomerase [Legionella taurinensis]|uniref:Phosphoheptose isomerase n=1 Tax=Legionella taurinensis TaxID=70611 RepID=A0AB38N9S2_9GAMM|nr:phosphoheptose isomerase [Legionella taurinensis]MDX1836485.1 phosphoheptose isomerase [Legionella taurinensis]PUT43045.1 phosphoheptose isomerase [Legionella taurinensis]PUT45136.1 phosphoheptose isomerase [Legionella taurinensis]PUT45601.1 phosphoheptose isomerase [Legionella taurinensis]PUT49369.1 phosphoheptose isomerase [Legionella taurinensis]
MLKIINLFVKFFKLYFPEKSYLYKIEEISECSNQVSISCHGKGVTIITTIEDIVQDKHIINFLPPHQACWLGYYFGKKWDLKKEFGKKTCADALEVSCDGNSGYRIICQNRQGEIIYQNSHTGSLSKMDPIELAKSKKITLFNASQAFYIGFLAALRNGRDIRKNAQSRNLNQPILKLVRNK